MLSCLRRLQRRSGKHRLLGRDLGFGRVLFVVVAILARLSILSRACGLSGSFVSFFHLLRHGRDGVGVLPVKVRPKTSSSGGTSAFGVVVLVMDRASGLMLGSLAISSSCDCML